MLPISIESIDVKYLWFTAVICKDFNLVSIMIYYQYPQRGERQIYHLLISSINININNMYKLKSTNCFIASLIILFMELPWIDTRFERI